MVEVGYFVVRVDFDEGSVVVLVDGDEFMIIIGGLILG